MESVKIEQKTWTQVERMCVCVFASERKREREMILSFEMIEFFLITYMAYKIADKCDSKKKQLNLVYKQEYSNSSPL